MNTPPKYPSTGHWPWSETVHRDDTYHNDPEFFLGKQLVLSEKLDGGNTCLYNGDVYARSTTQPATQGWFAMVKKHHAYKTVNDTRYAYYGEDLYGVHSIEYDPIEEDKTWRLFAVRDLVDDRFVSWDEVEKHALQLNVPTVPTAGSGLVFFSTDEITQWLQVAMKHGSEIGTTIEGWVIRTVDGFDANQFHKNVAKYVRKNHVQTDEHWTRNWKPCELRK